VRDGQVRDCHGDLRLQHIYAFDEPGTATHPLEIIDCIEFNERFRYGDVAAEVAFVTMELDAAGRSDLARAFVDAYVEKTRDTGLPRAAPVLYGLPHGLPRLCTWQGALIRAG
jgi:uncharacterized protein